jgi:hypothetical protein
MPASVRRAAEDALGVRVARASRVWGGYSPTPTFRLLLNDGRRAFLKAAEPVSNPFAYDAHAREVRVYRELGAVIGPWAPSFLGSFEHDTWRVMLLEDLGPKSVPPWTATQLNAVVHDLAAFHASTSGRPFPDWVPRASTRLAGAQWMWEWTADGGTERVAALAGERRREAAKWFEAALPRLRRAARGVVDGGWQQAFLHLDIRSDNLRIVGGKLKIFDWPHVTLGPPELDVAGFAQTVAVEEGVAPEVVAAGYAAQGRVSDGALDASVASLASYFSCQCWQPELPALPRLRPFQRAQMNVTLAWAARRLALPEPLWVNAVQGRTDAPGQ